jgi:hypothetical protein
MSTFDYTKLDPGIRETVRLVHEMGFRTTDSGDGVTKLADMECALDFPHVVIAASKTSLVKDAEKLHRELEKCGLAFMSINIEAVWHPIPRVAIIMLSGLSDEMLSGAKPRSNRTTLLG